MLKRRYIIVCDKCRAEFATDALEPDQARQEAQRWGWTRIKSSGQGRKDGEDRCPRHPAETQEGQ